MALAETDFEKWWDSIQSQTIDSRLAAAWQGWNGSWWHWARQGILMGLVAGCVVGFIAGWLVWRG